MNKVIIHGNLGQDPEIRTTQSGTSVCNLSVATNERIKDGDEWKDHTEWHRVTVWGRQADSCGQYLTKGRSVLVEGKLRTREWEDKDGNKRKTTEILADNVHFTSPKDGNGSRSGGGGTGGGGGGSRYGTGGTGGGGGSAPDDDDIPF